MYGTEAGTAAGVLATTGIATGSQLLAAAGLVMAGIAALMLMRRTKGARP